MLSRPSRVPRTTPASASTCKCRVTAWRVISDPSVSLAMDRGPCWLSRATSRRRVGSPSAPNRGADAVRARAGALRSMRQVLLDEPALMGPPALVGGKRLRAPGERYGVETRLRDGQPCAALGGRQLEDDQGGGFAGVVHVGVDGERVPAKRQEPFRLNPFDGHFERPSLVRLLQFGDFWVRLGRDDLSLHVGARSKGPVEGDAEPGPELARVAHGTPDSRD